VRHPTPCAGGGTSSPEGRVAAHPKQFGDRMRPRGTPHNNLSLVASLLRPPTDSVHRHLRHPSRCARRRGYHCSSTAVKTCTLVDTARGRVAAYFDESGQACTATVSTLAFCATSRCCRRRWRSRDDRSQDELLTQYQSQNVSPRFLPGTPGSIALKWRIRAGGLTAAHCHGPFPLLPLVPTDGCADAAMLPSALRLQFFAGQFRGRPLSGLRVQP